MGEIKIGLASVIDCSIVYKCGFYINRQATFIARLFVWLLFSIEPNGLHYDTIITAR